MKERCSIVILCSFIFCSFLSGFCTAVSVKAQDEASSAENLAEGKAADINTPSEKSQQEQLGKARKEVAQKEVEIVKETADSQGKIREAVEKAKQKEKEALAAQEKVTLAKEPMGVAQKKAMVAEKELEIAQEKAAVAESKAGKVSNSTYTKLFQTGLIVVGGYLAIFVLVHIINRRIKDLKLRHSVRKYVVYVLNILIVLYVVFLWVQNISSLTIFLSVISAGIALALQEVILSMAGWLLILVRRPFQVGDRIELGGVKGDVIDIRLFQTTLLEIGNWVEADQSTGRIVHVPNSAVFKQENFNYSRGFEFIWNELKILITFESDWKRAEKIMLKHGDEEAEEREKVVRSKINRMTKRYMIHYGQLTPIVYINIKDSGVELTLRYLTEARKRRTTQDALCRAILDDFEKEENVSLAYPTYRIVMNGQPASYLGNGYPLSESTVHAKES